jgi:hypothetical protein
MRHSTRAPTKAERAHLAAVKALPCMACASDWMPHLSLVEVHHVLSGNRRRGHLFVIPLCAWHHRGEPIDGWRASDMERTFGPSLARSSKRFHTRYGTDNELLDRVYAALAKRRAA